MNRCKGEVEKYKTVNASGKYAWLTTAMMMMRRRYCKNTSSSFKSISQKKKKCCYARCRKESNVHTQCLGRSKEDCEMFSSLSGNIGEEDVHQGQIFQK